MPDLLLRRASGGARRRNGRMITTSDTTRKGFRYGLCGDVVADLVQGKALDVVRLLGLAGAKHQTALMGRTALHVAEQVTIKRDLKDVFGPGSACQLGVPWLVGPAQRGLRSLTRTKKVGVAEPSTCRKRRLIDQGNAALHRVDGSGEARL